MHDSSPEILLIYSAALMSTAISILETSVCLEVITNISDLIVSDDFCHVNAGSSRLRLRNVIEHFTWIFHYSKYSKEDPLHIQ